MPDVNTLPITFNYSLAEEDFVTFQLYSVSISKRSIKKRRKGWTFVLGCLFLIMGMAYLSGNPGHLYFLIPFTFIVLLFFPTYQKWYYKRHYRNHIKEHYSNKVNITSTIVLDAEYISETSVVGEGKIRVKEVKELHETGEYLFVKVSTGDSLILPKSKVDTGLFKRELLRVLPAEDLVVREELGWKW